MAKAPSTTAAAPDAVDLRNLPVLVVDDNAANRRLLDEMLTRWRMVPTQVAGAPEALAALRARAGIGKAFPSRADRCPDARRGWLDAREGHQGRFRHRQMDGFECTAMIRHREHVTRVHLPIVAMTAHAMSGDEARCLAAGMDAYLSKPLEPIIVAEREGFGLSATV